MLPTTPPQRTAYPSPTLTPRTNNTDESDSNDADSTNEADSNDKLTTWIQTAEHSIASLVADVHTYSLATQHNPGARAQILDYSARVGMLQLQVMAVEVGALKGEEERNKMMRELVDIRTEMALWKIEWDEREESEWEHDSESKNEGSEDESGDKANGG